MDLKLWEYIFKMFNYKIRQKKIDFFKITNPYPALNIIESAIAEKKLSNENHILYCEKLDESLILTHSVSPRSLLF